MKNTARALLRKLRNAGRYIGDLRVPVYASHAGYFIILSLFPTLVLLLGLLRFTGLTPDSFMTFLGTVLPEVLMPAAKRLVAVTYQNAAVPLIPVSALAALWSASRGTYGLLTGLNSIYHVTENRGYLYTRGVSILYTLLFLTVLLLTLLLHVFDGTVVQTLNTWLLLPWKILNLRFFLLLGIQTAVFAGMYAVLPNRRTRFLSGLPGALFAAAGWLIFSDLYSIYVRHFSGYSNIFGSVYAVALCMLWLYCCISILFYGGALNYFLMDQKKEQ